MAAVPKPVEAGPLVFTVLVASMGGLGFYQLVYLPYLAPKDICQLQPEICSPPQKIEARIVLNAWIPSSPENFAPKTIVVIIGQNNTIRWTNTDTAAHTVTSDDLIFDSQLIQPGDSWTHTFKSTGIFRYHCTPHPWMKATVIVCDSTGCPGAS